jgi:hypothetical protein
MYKYHDHNTTLKKLIGCRGDVCYHWFLNPHCSAVALEDMFCYDYSFLDDFNGI